MDIEELGFIFDGVGTILVAYTAIAVHYRFRKEHKVDERVFSEMRREHLLGVFGLVLLFVGILLQYIGRYGGV